MSVTTSLPGPLMVDIQGTQLTAEDRALLADPIVGSVILFTRNFIDRSQLCDLCADIRSVRRDLLIAADYEGGRVQRFRDGFTVIPPMAALGKAHARNPADACHQAGELGWLVARELAEVGIDLPLAPVADRDHGQSTVIGHRAFASEPAVIAALAQAYADGLEAGGSTATLKHFPGHGWVQADSHAELPVDERDRSALAADWQPFADLIDAGIASVMMAHVRYPAVDRAPASLSPVWIGHILREMLGFEGCVFCDDLSMGGAAAFGGYAERSRAALAAGCDVLPVCNDPDAARRVRDALRHVPDAGGARRQALADRVATNRRRAVADSGRAERARRIAADLGRA